MVQFFFPIAALLAGGFLTIVWLALPVAGSDANFDSRRIDHPQRHAQTAPEHAPDNSAMQRRPRAATNR